jgi:hypothetical protein
MASLKQIYNFTCDSFLLDLKIIKIRYEIFMIKLIMFLRSAI